MLEKGIALPSRSSRHVVRRKGRTWVKGSGARRFDSCTGKLNSTVMIYGAHSLCT